MPTHESIENILVIGNGFDLHHGIPTRYRDFVNFYLDSNNVNVITKEFAKEPYTDIYDNSIQIPINELLDGNLWIELINKLKDSMDDRWCSLEQLIKEVVETLEKYDSEQKTSYLSNKTIRVPGNEVASFILMKTHPRNYQSFEVLAKQFDVDLRKLIYLLQKYLIHAYKETKIVKQQEIERLMNFSHISHVLNYNYTKTIEDLYPTGLINKNICYIHGKLDDYNSMVFGADLDENYSNNKLYLPFQKYYQKTVNKTDTQYDEWRINARRSTAIFYGFSFGEADGDTIQNLFNRCRAFCIFYNDQKSLADITQNLIVILGKQSFIEATKNKRIIFYDSVENNDCINELNKPYSNSNAGYFYNL